MFALRLVPLSADLTPEDDSPSASVLFAETDLALAPVLTSAVPFSTERALALPSPAPSPGRLAASEIFQPPRA